MRVTAAVVAMLMGGAAVNAAGAADRSRFEVWAGGSLADPALDTTYQTRYSPNFGVGAGAIVESTAGQSLNVHGSRALGAEAGLAWSPDGRWGIRLSAARSAGDLTGQNAPYSWSARIVTLPPPSNLQQTFDVAQQIDWPDTEGRLRVLTLALGLSRRWDGRRVGGAVSAGGALLRASGEVRSLGFTAFHLGGHSTFFTQEFEVEAALDPSTVAAFHAGADVDVALAGPWRLRLGCRFVRAADPTPTPRITRVVNEDEILLTEPLSRIRSELDLQPMRLALSSSRLLLSLVFAR